MLLLCRLSNVTKKSRLKHCSAFLAPFLRRSQFVNRMTGKKDRIHRSIYIKPRVESNESICPYYITAIYVTTRNDLLFSQFFFSLLFSTLSEALDKAKRKYQSKIKRLQEQQQQQLNQHEKA